MGISSARVQYDVATPQRFLDTINMSSSSSDDGELKTLLVKREKAVQALQAIDDSIHVLNTNKKEDEDKTVGSATVVGHFIIGGLGMVVEVKDLSVVIKPNDLFRIGPGYANVRHD